MVDLFTSNLSITKQIFNKDVILNYSKAFSDYLQVCLANIKSAKDNDFRGTYTRVFILLEVYVLEILVLLEFHILRVFVSDMLVFMV